MALRLPRRMRTTPADVDLRLRLSRLRAEVTALRDELVAALAEAQARAHAEEGLRAQLEPLAAQLRTSERVRLQLHAAYAELLARARAEVAEQRSGTPTRAGYLAGHLEEIGLQPPAGATPSHLVAEGLAAAARIREGR